MTRHTTRRLFVALVAFVDESDETTEPTAEPAEDAARETLPPAPKRALAACGAVLPFARARKVG